MIRIWVSGEQPYMLCVMWRCEAGLCFCQLWCAAAVAMEMVLCSWQESSPFLPTLLWVAQQHLSWSTGVSWACRNNLDCTTVVSSGLELEHKGDKPLHFCFGRCNSGFLLHCCFACCFAVYVGLRRDLFGGTWLCKLHSGFSCLGSQISKREDAGSAC